MERVEASKWRVGINKLIDIKIVDTGKDCADIKIKAWVHIINLKPHLNIMTSSWPLTR